MKDDAAACEAGSTPAARQASALVQASKKDETPYGRCAPSSSSPSRAAATHGDISSSRSQEELAMPAPSPAASGPESMMSA